jgi:hypothetical protein
MRWKVPVIVMSAIAAFIAGIAVGRVTSPPVAPRESQASAPRAGLLNVWLVGPAWAACDVLPSP